LFSAVVVSIVSLATIRSRVDFVGGRTFQVRFEKPVEAGLVKNLLKCLSAEAKIFGNDNQLKITTKYKLKNTV
jgi:SecD/SecF fusion protein